MLQASTTTARPAAPVARPFALRRASHVVHASARIEPSERGAPQQHPVLAAATGIASKAAVGALAALLLAGQPAEAKEVIQGFPRVVDGDTLDFSGTRVRLFGIDAPESKQSCKAGKGAEYMCGERSKELLQQKIGKSQVECEQKNRDKYGRVVGVCFLPRPVGQPEDLNAWLVQQGLAVAYRQYSKEYVPLEDEARAAKRGIWDGSFEMPQQWRIDNPRGGGKASGSGAAVVPAVAPAPAVASLPAVAPKGAPPGCLIKGNISAKGDKVYHVPGGAYYERTVIEESEGERWFCSAAEAEAAGWRASSK